MAAALDTTWLRPASRTVFQAHAQRAATFSRALLLRERSYRPGMGRR
jgi:hypothetical protein